MNANDETNRKIATVELRGLTACRCDTTWTARGLHEPLRGCASEYREDVDLLAGLAAEVARLRPVADAAAAYVVATECTPEYAGDAYGALRALLNDLAAAAPRSGDTT